VLLRTLATKPCSRSATRKPSRQAANSATPRPAVLAVMPAARRSFSSEVNVGLPKVTFRLVTRDAKFAPDSPLEGAGFEPSVPPERVCAFRDHVLSLQSVRRPLRSKWYIDDSDGPPLFGFDIHGQYLLVDVERASVSRTASGSG